MCAFIEAHAAPLIELIAMLPRGAEYMRVEENWCDMQLETYNGLSEALASVFDTLSDAADSCPACILAALRQAGIPAHVSAPLFNYKAVVKGVFAIHTDAEQAECQHG